MACAMRTYNRYENKQKSSVKRRSKKMGISNRQTHTSLRGCCCHSQRFESFLDDRFGALCELSFHFLHIFFSFRFFPHSLCCLIGALLSAHTRSSSCTHISWPLEMRYLPGSSERMKDVYEWENARLVYTIWRLHTQWKRRNIAMRSPHSMNPVGSARMTTAVPSRTQRESHDELGAAQRKTNEKMFFFSNRM